MRHAPKNRRDPARPGRGRRANGRRLPKTATQPALIRGVVMAVLALLAGLGFTWAADVDDTTVTLIVLVVAAAIPLVQALWTRVAVTPNAKVVARLSVSQDRIVAGDASAIPTGEVLAVFDVGENEKTLQPVPLNTQEI